MASSVTVYTYAQSVTYVTEKLLSSIKKIIVDIGLNPLNFASNWQTYESGVKTWLESKHLKEAVLEITSSTGSLISRCDFTIDYSYGTGDGSMWVDTDAIKYSIAKFGTIASSCNYRIVLSVTSGAPDVAGWSDCEFLSTEGFIKQNLGTTIGTNSIGAQAGYWRKAS
ncbi:MAG: hypothetical protein WKF85_04750 [Chitinophagaceae bacterium]